jgi:hypothetical protein
MLNKQTAVDIFHNRVNELIKEKKTITTFVIDGIWLECKEMEKEQMIKTSLFWSHSTVKRKDIEDYYNETYGGGEQ